MVVYGTVVVLKRSGNEGSRFPITSTTCTFGRDPSCDVRISVATVAQQHCKLEVNKNGQVILSDVSKINQTLLNGKSVKKQAVVNHNDVISVGERQFRWECAPLNDKSSILKQNYRLKSNSTTPVGIVSPIRRDMVNRESSASKSARKDDSVQKPGSLLTPSNNSSKRSRRASVPSYYGDPVLTPTFSIPRQRRSKSSSNVSSANSSFKKSSKRTSSKLEDNITSEEVINEPTTSKRSRYSTVKRVKMSELDDENTIKIIAPSSPDHKKSAALRTIHGSKIAVEKNKERKLMRVKNYREKKKRMVQRSEKIKQAVLKLHKTQSLTKSDSVKQTSRLMSVNEVKKLSKRNSSSASQVKDDLNSNVNLSNMFVSPIQTPDKQGVSYPMSKLISSIDRKKRDILMKSPDLRGLNSIFKTPELKSPSSSKVTSTKKNTSRLNSSQSEGSLNESPPKAPTPRKSLRKSESSSSDSPKTPFAKKLGKPNTISPRKSLAKSNKKSSPLKSPQSDASSETEVTRRSNRPIVISPRKSLANLNNSPSPLSKASFRDSPKKTQMTRRSRGKLPLSPRKSLGNSNESPSPIKSPLSEASFSGSPKKATNSPKIQVGRRSMRKSTISNVVTPRKSISKTVSKSPIKSVSPLRSPQSELSSIESPKISRKSSLNANFSRKSPKSASSFSQSPVKTRKSSTLQVNSPPNSPKDSFHLSESSSSGSPMTTRKSNISQRSSRRNASVDSEIFKTPQSAASEIQQKRKSSLSNSVSPRKSLSNSAKTGLKSEKNLSVLGSPESTFSSRRASSSPRKSISQSPHSSVNLDSSVSKSPKISSASFYSPSKSPKRVSSDFKLQLTETRSSLRSSILMKTPGSPSKLSPRKSLSYSTNEILLKTSPVPENTRLSRKSNVSTELNNLTLSSTPSPTKRKSSLSSPKRSISPGTSLGERTSRRVSRAISPINKSTRSSQSASSKTTTSPIKSLGRSRSTSPAKPILAKKNASPAKTRKSRSSSPEKIETSPGKRTSLRASSKINLLAVVNIDSRNVKSPAVFEEAQKSPEDKRKSKTRSTPQGDYSEEKESVQNVNQRRQKKMAAKLAVSIIQKSKRRSLTSINKSSNATIRQRRAKKSTASPNLSGLQDLFGDNGDDSLQTSDSAKQLSPLKKAAATSPRRLRARTTTPGYGLSTIRTRQKKASAESKGTPQAAASPRGKAKSLMKRKVNLEPLNTPEEEDDNFPEDSKVQSPTKGQATSQRRVSKRGTKATTLKIDLTPIKETPRKRAKISKLEADEEENVEEEEEDNSIKEKVPKTPKKQTKAKKESLMTSPAEVPKSRKRGSKVIIKSSPDKEVPKITKRRKVQSDEPEISTAKTTSRGRKAKNEDAIKSPDKSKEVKSVRASARLRNK